MECANDMEIDEKEWKKCVRLHGYTFSDSEQDSDTESKLVLDNTYETFKPPPIFIDPKKHKIIEIGSCDSDVDSTCTDSSKIIEKQAQKLTKSQKKRRRRKKVKENLNNVTSTDKTNDDNATVSNEYTSNENQEKAMPKIEHISNDAASTSSSDLEAKSEVTSANSTNESTNLNGTPIAYTITHAHIQRHFLSTLDSMLLQLNILIQTNATDVHNIFNQVQLCLKTVQTFGIKRKAINCVGILIVETAVQFKAFINDLHSNGQVLATPLKVNQFFNDLNTVILITVTKQHSLNLPEVMTVIENLVFVSFHAVLMNISEKIIKIIYQMTGLVFGNPFRHVVVQPGTVWEGYYDMLHLVNLARSIQHARITLPQVHVVKPPVTTKEQQNDCSCDDKLPVEVEALHSQSQLHPLIVDDLTTNRRFLYDGSYSGANLQPWLDFQSLYLNEKLHEEENVLCNKAHKREEVLYAQPQLHTLVIDDLTRDRSFLYPGQNLQLWQDFQSLYLNENLSILENRARKMSQVQSEILKSVRQLYSEGDCSSVEDLAHLGNKLVCVSSIKELSAVESPLSWALISCDVRILIGSVIFVLFFRNILYCIFCFGDVFMLILLLMYLCTYFVIKF